VQEEKKSSNFLSEEFLLFVLFQGPRIYKTKTKQEILGNIGTLRKQIYTFNKDV
jgi:hypothetical protein